MSKGGKSFAAFSVVTVPTILLFALLFGSTEALLGLLGVFIVLQFNNKLSR